MARTTNNSSVSRIEDGGVLLVANASDEGRQVSHEQHDIPRQRKLFPVPVNLIPNLGTSETMNNAVPVDAEEPEPSSPTTGVNRRGRKPSAGMSRSAREAARKSNHSRIEKLRREKINDALASLRELVPNDAAAAVDDEEDELAKVGGQQKEFKLDILERTVVYLRKLKARVEELEGEQPAAEADADSMDMEEVPIVRERGRRSGKFTVVADNDGYEDEDNGDQGSTASVDQDHHAVGSPHHVPDPSRSPSRHSRQPSTTRTQSQSQQQSPIVRLPSFSSLLNHSPLLSSPSSPQYQHSPQYYSSSNRSVDFPISPPSSGRSRPYQPSAMPNPPLLHLPSSSFPQSNDLQTLFPPHRQSNATAGGSRPWMVVSGGGAAELSQYSAERSSLSPEMTRHPAPVSSERFEDEQPRRGGDKERLGGATPASILGINHLVRAEDGGVEDGSRWYGRRSETDASRR
ncbi:hypothetical protein FRB95_005540 [Tulasnella sp. JGI-2019a]|nr:hypothetical protein FRB95_005540 [Tulasnella sp. JGI-2019a]